jgi:CRISPR-associated protein Cas5d
VSENLVSIRVWGDFACFTRPEMKVERVSYPLMTPSAARGILEAIFWEPQMYYIIDAIRVVKKGTWVSFRRNELISRASIDTAITWMKYPNKFDAIHAGGGAADGTQRNTLALENVEYIISAQVLLSDLGNRSGQNLNKYLAEIERRACQGKCFHRPALGVREFAANFEWEPDPQAALERRAAEENRDWRAIWPEEELGLMLYDVFDYRQRAQGFRWLTTEEIEQVLAALTVTATKPRKDKSSVGHPLPRHEGTLIKPQAAFFHASIKDAYMDCHPERVRVIANPQSEETPCS